MRDGAQDALEGTEGRAGPEDVAVRDELGADDGAQLLQPAAPHELAGHGGRVRGAAPDQRRRQPQAVEPEPVEQGAAGPSVEVGHPAVEEAVRGEQEVLDVLPLQRSEVPHGGELGAAQRPRGLGEQARHRDHRAAVPTQARGPRGSAGPPAAP